MEREEKELDSYLEEGTEKRVREGKGISPSAQYLCFLSRYNTLVLSTPCLRKK